VRTTYVARGGRIIEKTEAARIAPRIHLQGDYPDHVSPIDNSVIRGRAQRREHMKRHDVIDAREFGSVIGARRRERLRQQQS